MGTLADVVDVVIGVDTHKDTHTAAVVMAVGGTVETRQVPARRAGYAALLTMARAWEKRAWAIEGTASYGAGLARFLRAAGERVIELDHPKRAASRNGAKTDTLDAVRAAREALGREHLGQPREGVDTRSVTGVAYHQGSCRSRTNAGDERCSRACRVRA